MFKKRIRSLINELVNLRKKALIRNMALVGTIMLSVKIISFYKETLVASLFGLSEILDTYYIAILIPSFVQNVFIGALKQLFIPNYVSELKTSNQKGSFQTFVFISITAIVVALCLIVWIFTDLFLENIYPGHTDLYYVHIRSQLYYILPCLFFWGYASFMGGLLEIDSKYFPATITEFITPVVLILCLTVFNEVVGEYVLAKGMLIAAIVSFVYRYAMCRHHRLIEIGSWTVNHNMRMMLAQYPPKLTSGLLTGINPFVDQFFAAQLVVGSIAAINYGTKIPAFAVGLLMLAMGNVLLPHFSRLVVDNLNRAYEQLFKILKIVFFTVLSGTIVVIFLSKDIIRILFERNEFTAADTAVVGSIQQIALVYVPFYLCTLICVKFLTAINKNKFMAWTSLWNLLLNLVMNIILVQYFGVYGLVFSTTIVYIICSFIYVGYTYKQYKILIAEK